MGTLWQDMTYGIRMLLKKPGFTIAAILSLALGIGANTTIFSIINGTLLSRLPYNDPNRIMILWTVPTNNPDERNSVTAANYLAWKETSRTFSAIGGYYGRPVNLSADQNGSYAESIDMAQVSASLWDVLGVKPLLGRVFTTDEDQNGKAAKVAVLSYSFWQRHFAGATSVVGQTMNVDNEQLAIIGVMPKDFDFASNQTAYWTPMGFSPQQLSSAASFVLVAGRLKDGASVQQARSEMDSIAAGLRHGNPERNRDRGIRVEEIQDAFTQGLKEPLMILQGAVIFVLLIACSNVAGLLLARAAVRRAEVSVRAALGAQRWRVIRQLLTESVLLAMAGGILGGALGWAGLRLVLAAIPEGALPNANISVSPAVLAFTAAISILTGLVFGILPAFQTSKVNLATSLKESGRSGTASSARQRIRQVLVAGQIALALVLLIGAGLMMNTFLRLQSNTLGADTSNLLTFEFRFAQSEMMKPVGRFHDVGLWEINPVTGLTFDRVKERIAAIPGVVSAAGINRPPLRGSIGMEFRIQGKPAPEPGSNSGMNARYYAITTGYFSTMKIPLLQGRDFTTNDTAGAPPVVVVSKAMAERWWPGENPIGQHITFDFVPNEVSREIVGVVGDTLAGRFEQQPQPALYLPHVQQSGQWEGPAWNIRAAMFFVMRTQGDPNRLAFDVRKAIAEIDPNKPAGSLRTVEGYLDDGTGETRVFMILLAVFGISAAVLAALGIYGVMAYSVAQRTREIGIRVALGASSGKVIQLVVPQVLVLVTIGIAIGLSGAFALTRFLRNYLFQISPTDPFTFTAVSMGLLLIAVLACLVPTRRAVAVEPTVALRYE